MNLTYKSNKTALGKLVNGLTKEQAAEALPAGPPMGANPGSKLDVVEGTIGEGTGPEPSDWGAGAGANVVSRITEVGGAMSGGNCCGPGQRGRRDVDSVVIMEPFTKPP